MAAKSLTGFVNAINSDRNRVKAQSDSKQKIEPGQIGYDNPRENIDPQILTLKITAKQVNTDNITADDTITTNKLVSTGDNAYISGAVIHLTNKDAGGIVFLSSTRNLTTKTTTGSALYWDNDNTRLGVGTATPSDIVHVKGNNKIMILDTTSNSQFNLNFADAGTNKWAVYKPTANDLRFYDYANTADRITINGTGLTVAGTLIIASNDELVTNTGEFSNGAGSATGTLDNAPTAGNPTKWIKIIDNGTTRYIPTWE